MLAEKSDTTVTPLLFNLVDLILACLRSRNQQTIYVTLQLVSAILKRHHRYAVITLLKTDILPLNNLARTVGAHEQEVEYIMSLAETIGGHDDFDEVYQAVLRDTMSRLESHPCSLKLVAPRVSTSNQRLPDSLPGAPRDVGEHTLRPTDPLLNALLDLLETFFVNPVETNLSVTETLVDLAVCGFMKIEGWLCRSPASYVYEHRGENRHGAEGEANEEEDDEDFDDTPRSAEHNQLKAMSKCRERPQWSQAALPRILNVLKRLEDQAISYKKTIPRFDELVQQRRDAFKTADAMLHGSDPTPKATPAAQDTPDRKSYEELSRSASPSRPSTLEGLAHRLLSELGTPSRSSSPRGRKEFSRGAGSGNATPGSKTNLAPPNQLSHSRGRGTPGRSHSPSTSRNRTDPALKAEEEAAALRTAEFAAMDQTILSKKVGLPAPKVDPIPLKYDKEPMGEPTGTADLDDESEPPEVAAGENDADGQAEEVMKVEDKVKQNAKPEPETTDVEPKTTEPETPTIDASPNKKDVESENTNKVSVSHIVTNAIILQSFIFELASLVQVRAGLFDEVRFV